MATGTIGHTARVEVAGELDLALGDELEDLVAPQLQPGLRVEIDVRSVAFADSSGLGALVALAQRADEEGADLVLVQPSDALRRVLEVTDLEDLFHIVPAGTD